MFIGRALRAALPALIPGVLAAAVAGGVASAEAQAQAKNFYGDEYRVVGLSGSERLTMRARPSRRSAAVGYIPFNGRYIVRSFRQPRRGWVHMRFEGRSGWVRRRNLMFDRGGPTIYRVVAGRFGSLKIRSRPRRFSRVRGVIPDGADDVVSAGQCAGNWCRVRYRGVTGWADKHCLIVTRRSSRDWYIDRNDRFRSSRFRGSRFRGSRFRDGRRPAIVRRWEARNAQFGY